MSTVHCRTPENEHPDAMKKIFKLAWAEAKRLDRAAAGDV